MDLKQVYKMQRPAIGRSLRICFVLRLFLDDDVPALLRLVGVPTRLEGKGPRPVPQSWRAAHSHWRI